MTGPRILITGSRDYRGPGMAEAVFAAIRDLGGDDRDVVIVHGNAAGADAHAQSVAELHEFKVDRWDAPWDAPCLGAHRLDPLTGMPWCQPGHRKWRRTPTGGTYCPRAGHRRNQHMVNLGADIVLAFPVGPSRGTRDCIARAEAAGLEVRVHEQLRPA